jgi:kexin
MILPSNRSFSHKYGYGKLTASRILAVSRTFKNVGPHTNYSTHTVQVHKPIGTAINSTVNVVESEVRGVGLARLEYVTVSLTITHNRRGDVQVKLRSPMGVVSDLATPRKYDMGVVGFYDWTFTSVVHWYGIYLLAFF